LNDRANDNEKRAEQVEPIGSSADPATRSARQNDEPAADEPGPDQNVGAALRTKKWRAADPLLRAPSHRQHADWGTVTQYPMMDERGTCMKGRIGRQFVNLLPKAGPDVVGSASSTIANFGRAQAHWGAADLTAYSHFLSRDSSLNC
jgi:hypothetical protein